MFSQEHHEYYNVHVPRFHLPESCKVICECDESHTDWTGLLPLWGMRVHYVSQFWVHHPISIGFAWRWRWQEYLRPLIVVPSIWDIQWVNSGPRLYSGTPLLVAWASCQCMPWETAEQEWWLSEEWDTCEDCKLGIHDRIKWTSGCWHWVMATRIIERVGGAQRRRSCALDHCALVRWVHVAVPDVWPICVALQHLVSIVGRL